MRKPNVTVVVLGSHENLAFFSRQGALRVLFRGILLPLPFVIKETLIDPNQVMDF